MLKKRLKAVYKAVERVTKSCCRCRERTFRPQESHTKHPQGNEGGGHHVANVLELERNERPYETKKYEV